MRHAPDGCYVLPNGECIGEVGCVHFKRPLPDFHGLVAVRPLSRGERLLLRRAADYRRAADQLYAIGSVDMVSAGRRLEERSIAIMSKLIHEGGIEIAF